MRRSICYCSPSVGQAGNDATWKFIYTPSSSLPKGAKIKFDLNSQGREIDWEIPSADLKKASNVIYAMLGESDKVIAAKEVFSPEAIHPEFEFILPEEMKAGTSFTIYVGSKTKTGKGTRCQTHTQRRRSFLLYVDPKGKGHYGDPETFNMDIRGNKLHDIRILAPSFVTRNRRFDVTVRFEDEFGNLTSDAPEETLIELTHELLRENLNWKLFVPETGFITLPNMYFNEEGVYTISLSNLHTNEVFQSGPVKCFHENSASLLWGTLHGESERVDSTENVESYLRHFRDDLSYNFVGTSSFEDTDETPSSIWKLISNQVADFNEAERFNTFLGFQWEGQVGTEGLRLFIHSKDGKALLRKNDQKYNSLKKIYKGSNPKDLMSIPCFTMGSTTTYNFKNFDPEFEHVVEIYNAWGSSECLEKEGNPFPILGSGRKGAKEKADGSIRAALNRNLRFGFVAGGLDDRGSFADFFESGQEQYPAGLTAIIAEEQTRESLWSALSQRSCYATSGARILVDFKIASTKMGQETSTLDKPGLTVNRHIDALVAGTSDLETVEIIRKTFDITRKPIET